MSQVINTNALSLVAQNNLNKSQSTLGTAIQRLSSGLRINSAKDDAAGQAISNRFTASISGLTQASRNANDGISIAQTTEGALNEVNDNLQNIRRLTVQAQNGTNSDSDRQSIQDEIDARLSEIDRISDQTEFNGVKVLSQDQSLSIQVGSNDKETIDIDLTKMDADTLGMTDFNVSGPNVATLHNSVDANGNIAVDEGYKYDVAKATDGNGVPAAVTDIVKGDDGKIYVTDGTDYFEATDNGKGGFTFNSATKDTTAAQADNVKTVQGQEATQLVKPAGVPGGSTLKDDGKGNYYLDDGKGGLTKADVTIDKTAPTAYKATVTDTGVNAVNTTDPLKAIDAALSQVDKLRSGLGAVQNRFDSVISNLNNTVNNLSESRSRILDADFASEVSEMSRANILQSAGTSVLAQANQVPQNVLQLLR
ncbi:MULTISPECIES: FliC/FljB family flagellin [unclassified Escherichia]|uniref:FliC/FljB family flagellin n=1 Tax=unclassified Escherichia TaxID=2608889 RepID=UPI001028E762|nr:MULTISPECIES: FliC/FljB family flagellin [unclassified Escherichia]RZN44913.1 FliC/FljB family flagellin [Escherichia sp. E13S3]TGC00619.1 flagellin FliC [Escherichia sp. E2661]